MKPEIIHVLLFIKEISGFHASETDITSAPIILWVAFVIILQKSSVSTNLTPPSTLACLHRHELMPKVRGKLRIIKGYHLVNGRGGGEEKPSREGITARTLLY